MKRHSIWIVAVSVVLLLIAAVMSKFITPRNMSGEKRCVNSLPMMQSAKEQWAFAHHKVKGNEIVIPEVNEYMKDNTTPVCPAGGVYAYGLVGEDPTCTAFSVETFGPVAHRLPQQ